MFVHNFGSILLAFGTILYLFTYQFCSVVFELPYCYVCRDAKHLGWEVCDVCTSFVCASFRERGWTLLNSVSNSEREGADQYTRYWVVDFSAEYLV